MGKKVFKIIVFFLMLLGLFVSVGNFISVDTLASQRADEGIGTKDLDTGKCGNDDSIC